MNPSLEHQTLVRALINHFVQKLGFTIIAADFPGYTIPPKYNRHSPDIVAKDQFGILHFGEAKVSDQIFSEDSKEQFVDFSNRVMVSNGRAITLHIVVYKTGEEILMNTLREMGLNYKVNSRIKIWTL